MDGEAFGITVTARMRHADLLAAARRAGSQKALAEKLGVDQVAVSQWIGLKSRPMRCSRRTEESYDALAAKLYTETGKTMEELWPEWFSSDFLSLDKTAEITRDVAARDLLACGPTLQLPDPERAAIVKETITALTDTLTPRERFIVNARDGLNGNTPQTLEAIGCTLGLGRQRIKQIYDRAIRIMQRATWVLGVNHPDDEQPHPNDRHSKHR